MEFDYMRTTTKFFKELISIQKQEKYQNITSIIALFSILFFIFLNFYFPLARNMVLNYYFKDGFFYGIYVILIVFSGAIVAGATTSYLFYKFNYSDIRLFLLFYIAFFLVFYYFMLAESSFSFFVYSEMNGIFDSFLNAYTLYITIVLSAFLVSQLKESLKGGIGTGGGIIAALFSLGCPSCGALLWSIVGLGGLGFLPFHGFELRFLSLLILGWATKKSYESITFKDKKVKLSFSI